MQIFGVGPLELLLILVLALVIMGPQDMVGTARKLGRWIYQLVRSPTWRAIMETTQEFRDLPQKIVRDAGLDEAVQEIKDTANQVKSEMEATTREINTEMQAATSEINHELNTAAQEVNSNLQQVGSPVELAAGAPQNSESPTATVDSPAEPGPAEGPADSAAPSLDEHNPESILWPDLAAETHSDTAPLADPYVTCLDTFSGALGGAMKSTAGLELAPAAAVPQTITPEMIASAPPEPAAAVSEAPAEPVEPANAVEPEAPAVETSHPWAPGLALSGPAELDMQARFQERMAVMEKSFEELDARIMARAENSIPQPETIQAAALPPEPVEIPENGSAPLEAAAPPTAPGEAPASNGKVVESEPEDSPAR